MAFDIEAAFDKAVYATGGIRVTDRTGHAPPFANADYLFEGRFLVAELKTLQHDYFSDPRVVEKASRIYAEAHTRGGTRMVAYGRNRVSSDKFDEPYRTQLRDLYRVPFRRVVAKAHDQIVETKQQLGLDGYHGLFLLANQGHTALDPWHVVHLLKETLADATFPDIHYTVFFTVNLKANIAGFPNGAACWLPLVRPGIEPVPANFEKRLRKAWLAEVEKLTGQLQVSVNLPNYDSVANARNL